MMKQSNPYITGIKTIEDFYTSNNITIKTIAHTYPISVAGEILNSKISVPGYKFNRNTLDKDFLIEFEHDGKFHRISYSDMAIDIYVKIRVNPEISQSLGDFIVDIGIHGEKTPIPDALIAIEINPPNPVVLNKIKKNVSGHRLSSLEFGIPINYYPTILYWLGMNEEINYPPKKNSGWGGRRTAFKRLIEMVHIAELGSKENKGVTEEDFKRLYNILERIKAGKRPILFDFPAAFLKHFANIDSYEHAT